MDEPAFVSWDVSACGGASLAPDRVQAAWGNGQGALLAGERGGASRVARGADEPSPSGQGDPTGLALWSPDGSRLLVSWAAEGPPSYAVAELGTGAVDPVDARADGYFATGAWGWLDANRILFTLRAVRSLAGEIEYREGEGSRGDLALLDLRSGSFRTVTAVEDDTFLRPLARWGDGAVLVGETLDGVIRRYWVYDAATWARRPADLPAARVVVLADTSRIAFLGAEIQGAAPLVLRDRGGSAPLATVRLQLAALAWSPDGSRLAVAGSFDEPVPDQPGSFVTLYAAYVIEPR